MPGEFHPEAFAGFAGKVIERGVVFMTGMGMLGGVLHPAYSSPNYLMAVELWWSAHDGRGLSLLCAFEDWAAKNGADEVRMSAVAQHRGAAVGRLLTRRGYVAREVSFTKGL